MKINSKIRIALRNLILKAGSVETEKATLLYDADELEVGTEVFVENAEGEIVPAEDGEYVAGNVTYVVNEGRIAEIRKQEEQQEEVIETEEEPEADSADEPEQEQDNQPTVEERLNALEGSIAEIRDGIETLLNAVAALADRLEAVEGKVRGLEEPAADPAEEGEETEETFTSKMAYLRRK